ncbi:GRP family sugar transporter [Occallatibacter riparius]|uniref:GRP family sugar transporter n=1 Tax=Occallatibacter riparius TaxID=1002689 RepID=A0A9J7BPH2_9BACT|nr:GRP family sugar transporter [Occallatibacter riparius]UWZ84503.1 GRP family sugar transporter [Occallatibacter riparius]
MYIPSLYPVALFMMIVTMICWGSWANTQKLAKGWRFELFYWDYVFGIVLIALILGFTMGNTDPASPDSFIANLRSADGKHLLFAVLGGVVFNVANILIVAAIAVAGLAVAFPIGIGLALVIGSVLNYIILPKGNPLLLFGGIALVIVAIVLDALAYRRLVKDLSVSRKGILLSLLGGTGMGLFYPFVAKATTGENHLGPYAVAFVFSLGVLACTIPVNYLFMRKPISGQPVAMRDYFRGSGAFHFWGLLGGIIWGIGMISNFVASYAQMVGPAAAYALGQGATMVSAIWGVFVWREFAGAPPTARRLIGLMFLFFLLGLSGVAMAPIVSF